MLTLLFVLASLGVLLVEVIEVFDKCEHFPTQEMILDLNPAADR